MHELTKIFDMWPLKAIISSILLIFTPFKVSLIVLLLTIIVDSVLGIYIAVKSRKFTSRGFKKGTKKLVTYFTTVAVVRLFEIGISGLINTTIYTEFILGYLTLTETTSILENLVLLGVPIPYQFIKKLLDLSKMKLFKGLLDEEDRNQDYIKEIDDMIKYQVPNIKSESIRNLIIIKFEEWKNTINLIGLRLFSHADNDDIIFYRILYTINNANKIIIEKWKDFGISDKCIYDFMFYHQPKIDKWLKEVEAVCHSSITTEQKHKLILDKMIIILYQTLVDVQKGENSSIENCDKEQ